MFERLIQREREGKSIRVAIVGMGHMGSGVSYQISRMRAVDISILADLDIERALNAYEMNGIPKDQVIITNEQDKAQEAILKGKPVATEDGELPSKVDVDAVIEATGIPEVGARVAYQSILGRKNIVMLNVEADVVVGPTLSKLAKSVGVVYTLAAGDQPGAVCEIADWARSLGLEVVAAGRGTQLGPDDRYLTPDNERFQNLAKSLGGNPKMYCSFQDGTKSQVEMAATSNALGLGIDVRGMNEPFACVEDLPGVFSLKENGGVLSRTGVVELANSFRPDGVEVTQGMVNPGVFVVVTTDHPGIQRNLKHLFRRIKKAGPNFALFRPYHLPPTETPYSVIRACIHGEATGAAQDQLITEVIAVAKKDLKAGEMLDGNGGFTVYGLVERAEVAREKGFLPLGFAYGISMLRDVPRDTPIKKEDVKLDTSSFLYKLREMQDAL